MSQVGRTALIAACEHGNLEVVKTLLAAGAYKEAKDKVGVYLRPYGRGGGGVFNCGEGATTLLWYYFTLCMHRSGARHLSERPVQGVTPRWSWNSWLPGADGDPSQGEAAEASEAAHTLRWSCMALLAAGGRQ